MTDSSAPHDLERLREHRARLAELEAGTTTTGYDGEDNTPETIAFFRRAAATIEAAWPDERLLAAYQRTTGEPGDAEADALLGEIERRQLDV